MSSNDNLENPFEVDQVLYCQIAEQAPHRGITIANVGHDRKFQVFTWEVKSGVMTQVSHDNVATVATLDPLGRYIYAFDDYGTESGIIYRIPWDTPRQIERENLVHSYGQIALSCSGFNVMAFSRNGRVGSFVYVTTDGYFRLYWFETEEDGTIIEKKTKEDINRLPPEKILVGPILSYNGNYIVYGFSYGSNNKDSFGLAVLRNCQLEANLKHGEGTNIEAVCFEPNELSSRVLAHTNRNGNVTPIIWNPSHEEPSSDQSIEFLHHELEGDVIPLDWNTSGEILLSRIKGGREEFFIYNLRAQRNHLQQVETQPGSYSTLNGRLGKAYFHPTSGEIIAIHHNSIKASEIVRIPRNSGEMVKLSKITTVKFQRQVPWESFTVDSTSGQPVQSWLGRASHSEITPVVIDLHGGPKAVKTAGYYPDLVKLRQAGFTVCSVNYSGSIGFGRHFREKIYPNLGEHELQDLLAVRTHLVKEGIAYSDKIFLYGPSYGGYLALLAMGRQPDLWAGAVGIVPIADFSETYKKCAPAYKALVSGWLNGTTPDQPNHKELWKKVSPVTYVQNIKHPILIIFGSRDTRVPTQQVKSFVNAMETAGKDKLVFTHQVSGSHTIGMMNQLETFDLMNCIIGHLTEWL